MKDTIISQMIDQRYLTNVYNYAERMRGGIHLASKEENRIPVSGKYDLDLIVNIMKGLHEEVTFLDVYNEFNAKNGVPKRTDDEIKTFARSILKSSINLLIAPALRKDNIQYFEYIYRNPEYERLDKQSFDYDEEVVKKFTNDFIIVLLRSAQTDLKISHHFISRVYTILMNYYFSKDDDNMCITLCKAIHRYFEYRNTRICEIIKNNKNISSEEIEKTIKRLKLNRPVVANIGAHCTYLYYFIIMYKQCDKKLYKLFALPQLKEIICYLVAACADYQYSKIEQRFIENVAQFVDSIDIKNKNFKFMDYVNLQINLNAYLNTNHFIQFLTQNKQMFDCVITNKEGNLDYFNLITVFSKEYCDLLTDWLSTAEIQKGVTAVRCALASIDRIINISSRYDDDGASHKAAENFKTEFISTLSSKNAKIQGIMAEVLLTQ